MKTRTAAMQNCIPVMTRMSGGDAALEGIKSLQADKMQVL